jgi:hypothetical protein
MIIFFPAYFPASFSLSNFKLLIMKQIFTALCLLLLSAPVFAQATEGLVQYKQKQYAAAVTELPYSTDVIESAMKAFLSNKGRSSKDDVKGFVVFRNTQLNADRSQNADLYFKVDKNRKEKNASVVSLLLSKPETALNATVNNMSMQEARVYLDELSVAIAAHHLELMINDQNKNIIKAEDDYKEMTQDAAKMQNKMTSLQKDIEENAKKQELKLAQVNNEKQKLAALVSKRKS